MLSHWGFIRFHPSILLAMILTNENFWKLRIATLYQYILIMIGILGTINEAFLSDD